MKNTYDAGRDLKYPARQEHNTVGSERDQHSINRQLYAIENENKKKATFRFSLMENIFNSDAYSKLIQFQ